MVPMAILITYATELSLSLS